MWGAVRCEEEGRGEVGYEGDKGKSWNWRWGREDNIIASAYIQVRVQCPASLAYYPSVVSLLSKFSPGRLTRCSRGSECQSLHLWSLNNYDDIDCYLPNTWPRGSLSAFLSFRAIDAHCGATYHISRAYLAFVATSSDRFPSLGRCQPATLKSETPRTIAEILFPHQAH